MKIRALWGFTGTAALLGAESAKVKRGDVFEEVDDEYGHTLVGKGLVEELSDDSNPKVTKPKESKPAASKESK